MIFLNVTKIWNATNHETWQGFHLSKLRVTNLTFEESITSKLDSKSLHWEGKF